MVDFFFVMTIVSTIIAIIASVVFFVGILFESQTVSNRDVFSTCNRQIKVCRVSSVIFAILYWFVVSGLQAEECLEGYKQLSTICLRLGYIWIVFAFVNVIINIILGITERGKDELEIMRKLCKSGFMMGASFLVIAFVLTVN